MSIAPRLTPEQSTQIGYTKWETVLAIMARCLLIAVVFLPISLFTQPLIEALIPGSDYGSPPRSVMLIFGIDTLVFIFAMICAVVICVCEFVLGFTSLKSENLRRMRPFLISALIQLLSIMAIFAILVVDMSNSIPISTGGRGGWMTLFAGIIIVITLIISYCIYRKRLKQDLTRIGL